MKIKFYLHVGNGRQICVFPADLVNRAARTGKPPRTSKAYCALRWARTAGSQVQNGPKLTNSTVSASRNN